MKTCSKCGETKEKSEFGNYARSPDGLNSGCKKCRNANSLNYKRLRTPEKILLERQEKEAAENRLNRGLTCNPGLGLFKDSPKMLRAAADYLEGI